MDPMTMMALANFGMQMMKGSQQGSSGGGQSSPQGGGMQQQQQRPMTPGPLPQPIAPPSPFTAAVQGGMPQNPMMAMPGMQQMARPMGM